MHIFVAVLFENVRHPGAGRFVRSSAVGHDRPIAWNVGEMWLDLIGGNANGARESCFSLAPRFWIARVNKKYVFSAIQTIP